MLTRNTDNWGGLNVQDNKWNDAMWGEHVPACGKSKCLGGEILRAINRIVYKFYNDGDTVARYYSSSYNHSYGAEKFLMRYVPSYVPMRNISYYDSLVFEDALCRNLKRVIDYLRENPCLFEKENTEDFLDLSPKEDWPDYLNDEDDEWDEWNDDEDD